MGDNYYIALAVTCNKLGTFSLNPVNHYHCIDNNVLQVSRPVWNRDYFYLNGKIQQVRDYLKENCVHTVADDLFSLALDIFSR